jgi:hypothetical protein
VYGFEFIIDEINFHSSNQAPKAVAAPEEKTSDVAEDPFAEFGAEVVINDDDLPF